MAGDGDRFDEGGLLEVHGGGQGEEQVGGDGPGGLHGTGGFDADHLQPMADMVVASETGRTCAARDDGHDDDGIAHGEAFDTGAEFGNSAGAFMADDLGEANAMVEVAQVDVKVSAADAAVGDSDTDLSGGGSDGNAFPNIDLARSAVVSSFHRH